MTKALNGWGCVTLQLYEKKSSIIPFWLQILNSWATEQLQIISTKNHSHT